MVLVVLIFTFGIFFFPPLSLNTNNMETVIWTIPIVLPNAMNMHSGSRMVFIEATGGSF